MCFSEDKVYVKSGGVEYGEFERFFLWKSMLEWNCEKSSRVDLLKLHFVSHSLLLVDVFRLGSNSPEGSSKPR